MLLMLGTLTQGTTTQNYYETNMKTNQMGQTRLQFVGLNYCKWKLFKFVQWTIQHSEVTLNKKGL